MSKQRLTDRLIASGISLNDLIHIVNTGDTTQNPYGSSFKGTVQQLANVIVGSTGSCTNDIYVSNIHSCSPLNINPLDEGNVYFGSTSGVTIDVTNSRIGVGTPTPQYTLDVVNTNSRLFYNPSSDGGLFIVSGTTNIPRFGMLIPSYLTKPIASATVGLRSWDDTLYSGYGKVGDMFIRSSAESNGLNLISAAGSGTEDYIRFYAGQASTGIADLYIGGTGSTRGFVGIGTVTPTEKLDVSGKTKTTTLQVTSNADINGNLTVSTISATTYNNLPPSVFSGGTVTGPTTFTNGLTATTISATTYYNLPTDVFVTGGTYTSGNAIFTNNTGGTFNVSGFPIGGGGGQTFYLNLSQPKNGYRFLSTTASTASEQTSGVTINAGLTDTIASFQTNPLNITLLPGGIWSFYLHSYKSNTNASFNIFVEVYKRTSGGTETLLFATDPTPVTTNSPNPSMQLTDGYFSGTPLTVSDSIVAKVSATNTNNQPHIITLVTEGPTHYSYAVSTIPTQQGLTCDTLSGCTIIQTIQTNISNKYDKSGGTVSGNLTVNGNTSLQSTTASTVTVTNRSGTPSQVASFDTSGKLVAGVGTLGQTTYSAFGTSTLTITNATVGYQLIPGLTQTITVPNNCSVYVFTSGGVQNSNGSSTSFTVDVALFVDGVGPLTNGSFRRVTTTNPNTVNFAWTSALWSMGALLNLSAGNHTIDVRSIYRNTSNVAVSALISSDLTLNRQGELYIMIIKN